MPSTPFYVPGEAASPSAGAAVAARLQHHKSFAAQVCEHARVLRLQLPRFPFCFPMPTAPCSHPTTPPAVQQQKRMERLQLSGIAQPNEGLIRSRPGSAATTPRRDASGNASGAPRAPWEGAFGSGAFSPAGGISPGGGASARSSCTGSMFGDAGGAGDGSGAIPPALALGLNRSGTSGGAPERGPFERVAPFAAAPPPLSQQQQPTSIREHGEAERQLAARGLAAEYDPHSDGGNGGGGGAIGSGPWPPGTPRGSGAGGARLPPRRVDPVRVSFTDAAAFLLAPAPREGPVQCTIVRERDGNSGGASGGGGHCYRLFLDDGRRFVAAARRRKGTAASHYDITTAASLGGGGGTAAVRDAPGYMGKLRANFLGTEFVLFDAGSKPARGSGNGSSASGGGSAAAQPQPPPRRELAAVVYEPNVLGTKGPRRMLVGVRAPGAAGTADAGSAAAAAPLAERVRAAAASADGGAAAGLVVLQNRAPRWNGEMRAFCLNFGGRVTVASVKNFQLVALQSGAAAAAAAAAARSSGNGSSGGGGAGSSSSGSGRRRSGELDPETVVLQFGKAGADAFTCDVRWPLTPLQAFGVCLSSFDGKLACE